MNKVILVVRNVDGTFPKVACPFYWCLIVPKYQVFLDELIANLYVCQKRLRQTIKFVHLCLDPSCCYTNAPKSHVNWLLIQSRSSTFKVRVMFKLPQVFAI